MGSIVVTKMQNEQVAEYKKKGTHVDEQRHYDTYCMWRREKGENGREREIRIVGQQVDTGYEPADMPARPTASPLIPCLPTMHSCRQLSSDRRHLNLAFLRGLVEARTEVGMGRGLLMEVVIEPVTTTFRLEPPSVP